MVSGAVFRVHPEDGSRLEARTQRDQQVLRNVPGLQSDRLGARAVNLHVQGGIVESLLHVHVDGSGDVLDLGHELFCNLIVAYQILSHNLDVDGRGHAEIQDLGHDVGRLEEKLRRREPLGQQFAKSPDVGFGRASAILFQLQENLGVGCADGARIAVGHVDAAVRQTDIVENGDQIPLGNDFLDGGFHLVRQPRGLFDPQPGTGAHVQANLARVHARKIITADHKSEPSGQNTKAEKAPGK